MAYRALKTLRVGDAVKEPGDFVPEAVEWGNLQVWLNTGFIEEVPDELYEEHLHKDDKKAAAPKKTVAKRKTATKRAPTKKE